MSTLIWLGAMGGMTEMTTPRLFPTLLQHPPIIFALILRLPESEI